MYQNPHNAPKMMISGIGVKNSKPLHADKGKMKRAIIAPSQSSVAVKKTHRPPSISDVSNASTGAKVAAVFINSPSGEGFNQNIETCILRSS